MLVGYARVSTQDQNLELQRDALSAATCERISGDKVSGAKAAWLELTEALAYVRPGDTLIIWKLSRLGPMLKQLIETVDLLRAKGLDMQSLHESIDTGTATGKLLFHIVAAFAQFEWENMIENPRASLEAARSRGKMDGRQPVLDAKKQAQVRALRADPTLPIAESCKTLSISQTTLYHYTSEAPKEHASPKMDKHGSSAGISPRADELAGQHGSMKGLRT